MTESWQAWAVLWRRHPDLAESFYYRLSGELPLFRDEERGDAADVAFVLNSRYPGCGARAIRVRVRVEEVADG